MTTNERDTHFFGFAKLLVAELEKAGFIQPIHGVRPYTLIAQRAYDLVYHTRVKTAYGMDLVNIRAWIELEVPDMTDFPD